MNHRLAVLRKQAELARTKPLREQYCVNIKQIEDMMAKEPAFIEAQSAEYEVAFQIIALDEEEERNEMAK